MKSIIMIILLMLGYCTVIFADTAPSTNTAVTTTTTVGNEGKISPGKPAESTTYTTITSTTSTSIDDVIVSAVYAKYAKDPALTGTSLTVTSQNGIVTINGTVTAQSQADAAVIAAKSIKGVKDARSNIHVTTNPNPYKSTQGTNY